MSTEPPESLIAASAAVACVAPKRSLLGSDEEKKVTAGEDTAQCHDFHFSPQFPPPTFSPDSESASVDLVEPSEASSNEERLDRQDMEDETYSEGSSEGEVSDSEEGAEGQVATTAAYGAARKHDGSVWSDQVSDALKTGLTKFPYLGRGKSRFSAFGQKLGRAAILSEFVRRQTGQVRSVEQINCRLHALKNAHDGALQRSISGSKIDKSFLRSHNWEAELGPDLFPPTITSPNDASTQTQKKRKRSDAMNASRAGTSSPQRPSSEPTIEAVAPFSKQVKIEQPQDQQQPRYPPLSCRSPYYPPSYPFPPLPSALPPCATALPPPAFPSTLPVATTLLCFLAASDSISERLEPYHLAASFTSAFPPHDFTAAAESLNSSGVTTIEALIELVLIEDEALDDLFILLSRHTKLSGIKASWGKKAVRKLRAELSTSML
ncbi:hypothetical protein JCM11251_002575 [Rhodosporidiobolus azoricus]